MDFVPTNSIQSQVSKPAIASRTVSKAGDEGMPGARKVHSWGTKHRPHLAKDQAKRQGEITRLAFLLLGRDAAIAFLNTEHAVLGGRPLDVATADDEGRNCVEAEIGRMAYAEPRAEA